MDVGDGARPCRTKEISGLSINIRIGEANKETQAQGLVKPFDADTAKCWDRSFEYPLIAAGPIPIEKDRGGAADTSARSSHASLALLPVDANRVDFLFSRLLDASPTELPVPVIRDALKPHQASLIPKLWSTLDSAKPGDVSLLRAASALADYDGTSPRWEAVGGEVAAKALVTVNPVYLGPWLNALLPVRGAHHSAGHDLP